MTASTYKSDGVTAITVNGDTQTRSQRGQLGLFTSWNPSKFDDVVDDVEREIWRVFKLELGAIRAKHLYVRGGSLTLSLSRTRGRSSSDVADVHPTLENRLA